MAASRRGGVRPGLLVMLPLALGRPSDGEAPACPGATEASIQGPLIYIGRGGACAASPRSQCHASIYMWQVALSPVACRHEAPRNGVGPHGEGWFVNGAAAVQRPCCSTKHHLSAKCLSSWRDRPKFCAIVSLLRSSSSFVERRGQASATDPKCYGKRVCRRAARR